MTEGRDDVEALIPRWLFALQSWRSRLAVAVLVPGAIAVPMLVASDPASLRFGPLLALGLIAVAAIAGSVAAIVAGVIVVAIYSYDGIPPSSSFEIERVEDGIALGAMVALALGLPWVTHRIARAVADVRALDERWRRHADLERSAREQAERSAAQVQAALAMSNTLAEAESMSEVAARLLDHLDQPARPSSGSVAIVRGDHLQVLAARGASPELLRALERVDLRTSPWLGQVLRGVPAFIDDRADFAARYPTARVLSMYPSGSWTVLPFRSESTVGLLSLHYLQPQPLTEHAGYFSLVAELLSAAMERARAVERQRQHNVQLERAFAERDRIARTLSTTLLPPNLPTLAGFAMAGWLVPASADEVAGDFYDVFAVDDGGWVAVLGDVCGKGAEAAAVTALARYAARASALDNADPLHVAEVANRALDRDPSDLFCTMALVRYADSAIDVVLAGHLQVRHVRPGTVTRVGHYASPLGLMRTHPRVESRAFEPGATVVLFSDGLVERNLDFGEDELDAVLLDLASLPAPDFAAELRQRVLALAPHRQDDLAALVISYLPRP